jgi:hypothetical protein
MVVEAYAALQKSNNSGGNGDAATTPQRLRLVSLSCESVRNMTRQEEQPPMLTHAAQLALNALWAPARDLSATLAYLQQDETVKRHIDWVAPRPARFLYRSPDFKPPEYITVTPKYPNPRGYAVYYNASNFMAHLVLDTKPDVAPSPSTARKAATTSANVSRNAFSGDMDGERQRAEGVDAAPAPEAPGVDKKASRGSGGGTLFRQYKGQTPVIYAGTHKRTHIGTAFMSPT